MGSEMCIRDRTTSEIGNSLTGPGRRRVGLESHRPGRAWARDFGKITRWAGRGLGQAPSTRPGSTPPPRVGPPAKIVGFEILHFSEFENITKRDIKRDISAVFVRNGMSRTVIFCHAQMVRIETVFFLR